MNKKLAFYCEEKKLMVDGNNAYGIIDNYEVNVVYRVMDNVAPVLVHISFYASNEDKRIMVNQIREQKIKFLQVGTDPYGLSIGLNDFTVGALMKRLDNIITTVLSVVKSNNGKNISYCPLCGEELSEESKIYNVDGLRFKLDSKCVSDINAVIEEENKDFDQAPNNYGKGLAGILLGALVGVISYIIFFMLGFISAISAFISIMLGTFLYKKFGGKPNMIMVIMGATVTLLSLVLTVFVLYILAAIGFAYEAGVVMGGLDAFKMMMEVNEFSAEFISNLLMTILFTILGAGYEVYNISKSVKRTKKID